MQMDAGLDTGPVIAQTPIPIELSDTAQSLHDRLAQLGAQMIVAAVDSIARGNVRFSAQREEAACYARKIDKSEACLMWRNSAVNLDRQIRAFNPAPGAYAMLHGEAIKIWGAIPNQDDVEAEPGKILQVAPSGIEVACGAGSIRLTSLQKAGGKRLTVAEFLRGFSLVSGDRFDT
jgi:methionyl-tRNA formyltransferase